MPAVVGGIVVALIVVVVIALTVSGEANQQGGPVTNRTEVADVVTVQGTPLPQLPEQGADPAIGRTAPITEGVDFDGAPVAVPQQGPGVVVIVAHWCPFCREEIPVIVKLRESGQWPSNVALAGISTAVAPPRGNFPPSAWLTSAGWDAPVLVDTKEQTAGNAYGLTGFPFLVWTDSAGKVVLRTSGQIPEQQFARMLQQLSRGETPTLPGS